MKSYLKEIGAVPLAPHTGERVYMREFRKADGLPFDLARWQPTVDAMLAEVDTDGPIYLMVDQGAVKAGAMHRRGGVHVDGYWIPNLQAHGNGGGGHRSTPHLPNSPLPNDPGGRHQSRPMHSHTGHGGHRITDENAPLEALILASNIAACRAYIGQYDGVPSDGGDCGHIDTSALQRIILAPNVAYAGNVAMLHESLPVPVDCLRTVVRLNVPGWSPK